MADTEPKTTETPPAEPAAPAFDWTGALPDGAPGPLGKYKDWGEAQAGISELQRSYNEGQERIKALEKQIPAPAPKTETEPTAKPKAKAEPEPEKMMGLTTEEWDSGLAEYYADHSLSQTTLDEIRKKTNAPEQIILQVMESRYQDRQAFFDRVSAAHEGVDMAAIEAFLQSGKSGFSEKAIAGFQELAVAGDVGWVATVNKKYHEFAEAGGSFDDPRTGQAFGAPPAVRHGTPAGGNLPGFRTREDYQKAYDAARADNTPTAPGAPSPIDKVFKKLNETPDHVKATWGV